MAITANDLITDAFLHAQIGDVYNNQDANNVALALRFLNDMLDSWSTEELTIYDIIEGLVTLTNGTAQYVMGPGSLSGVTTRPVIIEDISIVSTENITYPVRIIGVDQWSKIAYKPAVGRPEVCYVDYSSAVVNLNFYTVPTFTGDVAHVWYGNQLAQFTTLTQVLSAPPGFQLAYKLGLAVMLCNAYGRDVPPALSKAYYEAKKNVRNLNNQPKILSTDIPVSNGGPSWYSIYSDQYY